MRATSKLRGAAWVALFSMLLGAGLSLMPVSSADAGWYGRGYYNGGYSRSYNPRYSYGGYRGYYNNTGAAVAAGVAGLAAGAIIGGALAQPRYYPYAPPSSVYIAPPQPQPYDPSVPVRNTGPVYSGGYAPQGYAPVQGSPDWNAYCASKYRSFNPATGMFLGYDGQYHYCR